MPGRIKLELTNQQRGELQRMRDHHSKGYLRERAAALLKIADGTSATHVAYGGLLRKRYPHAVCEWVRRYKAQGMGGLLMQEGRGRKPAFFPSATHHPTSQASVAAHDKTATLPAGL
jgi:hypothetical protein